MEKNYNNIACLTIVSKNYISTARVLCDSFLEHHPGARFFVVLVDKLNGEFDPANEKFELLSMYDIGLPAPDVFPYQYTILELNTAVKPFALKHLLQAYDDIKKLTYIDPDIMIASSLDKVWNGLEEHTVVLTPHMREPFSDNANPSEVGILQSGTYNLGFIGLADNKESIKLLDWWIGKLYLDCIVDIPNGLFVDQKWMDLVPAYYENTLILHDPSYNAAYWNLHERDITEKDGNYFVDGIPLSFFHFSGYDPRKPDVLSKHQSRHQLEDGTAVKKLFDLYGSKLLDADLVNSKEYVYAYGILPNGIPVSRAMHLVIRHCLRNHIVFPSPEDESDAFCKFMMTPTSKLFGSMMPPIFHGLLMVRPDVKAHFPDAWNGNIEGFTAWLNNSGKKEENLDLLLENFGYCFETTNPVLATYMIYDARPDVRNVYQNLAFNKSDFDGFIKWLKNHGTKEAGVTDEMIARTIASKNGFFKAVTLYFMRPDLQTAFPNIHKTPENYFNWLRSSLHQIPQISEDETHTFLYMSKYAGDELDKFQIKHNAVLRDKAHCLLTHFNKEKFIEEAQKYFAFDKIDMIEEELHYGREPLYELEAYYACNQDLQNKYPEAFTSTEMLKKLGKQVTGISQWKMTLKNSKWFKDLKKQIVEYQPDPMGINIAGYFNATTGMGQAARSLESVIEASGLNYSVRTLPNLYIDESQHHLDYTKENYFGTAVTENRINLVVANADAIGNAFNFFPKNDALDRKNVGFWFWETEELPSRFNKSADHLDEVWTASEYCAEAIRKTIDVPVRVLPLTLDFDEIDEIIQLEQDRKKFALPEESLIFGYFFDQKSVLARKNPQGVIDAFRKAFGSRSDVCLLMKVNTPRSGDLEYELLKAENQDLNIIWFEETLSRTDTLQLMNCLDVYVSLHRSEGFGLTMAEAMALGKPVIASNYSSNTEFMNDEVSLMVDTPQIKTTKDFGPYPRGTVWGDPDIYQAADYMIRTEDIRYRQTFSNKASEHIRKTLNCEHIATCLKNLLKG